jgi:hypothetical protein
LACENRDLWVGLPAAEEEDDDDDDDDDEEGGGGEGEEEGEEDGGDGEENPIEIGSSELSSVPSDLSSS